MPVRRSGRTVRGKGTRTNKRGSRDPRPQVGSGPSRTIPPQVEARRKPKRKK